MTQRFDDYIPDETAAQLREMKERRQTSLTEELRRAVGMYAAFEYAASQGKGLEFSTHQIDENPEGQLESTTTRRYFRLEGDSLMFIRTTQYDHLD